MKSKFRKFIESYIKVIALFITPLLSFISYNNGRDFLFVFFIIIYIILCMFFIKDD